MRYKVVKPFLWFSVGTELSEDEFRDNWDHHVGNELVKIGDSDVDLSLDLNKDGKVDKKDAKIASKVMNQVRKSKRKAKGRRGKK